MKFSKINLYLRTCWANKLSSTRPEYFSIDKCFKNLLSTINWDLVNMTVVFNGNVKGNIVEQLQSKYPYKIKEIDTNTYTGKSYESNCPSSKSYCLTSQIIKEDNLSEDSLIFVLENDYIFRPVDWATIVLDLYNNYIDENSYLSLFDHPDKFMFSQSDETIKKHNLEPHWKLYRGLKSEIILSSYSHFRETPSITSTWIMPKRLFDRDFTEHSLGVSDNTGCNIWSSKHGTKFYSPIPSINCHCERFFIPPFIPWEFFLEETSKNIQ